MIVEKMISVIIPVYEVSEVLDRCIQSVVEQTYSNLEIILIDDGSKDCCPDICDKWAKKDSRIVVIHKTNGGLSDARNKGLEIAKGDFIGFVDSDDWIAPKMYEELIYSIMNNNSDIAVCGIKLIWEDGRESQMLTKSDNCLLRRLEAQLELLNESKLKHPVVNRLYKREVIKDLFFEIGRVHEDVFWSYQAIGRSKLVSIIDYVGYYYWQRKGSIMSGDFSLKRLDAIKAKCNRQDYFKMFFPELVNKGLVDIWFSCIYLYQRSLKEMSSIDQIKMLEFIKKLLENYPINQININELRMSHYLWIKFANISFVRTCKLRNWLGIGK